MPQPLAEVKPPQITTRRRTRAAGDVHTQRKYDHRRRMGWTQFDARHQAVLEARAAVRAGEHGARFALRQALIDLAACAEEMCVPMMAPTAQYQSDV